MGGKGALGVAGKVRDLLAAWFVKGSDCAHPLILTEVITWVGQLITTLVLEP